MFDDYNLELVEQPDETFEIVHYNFEFGQGMAGFEADINEQPRFFVCYRETWNSDDLERNEDFHQLANFRSGVYVLMRTDANAKFGRSIFVGMLNKNEQISLADCLRMHSGFAPEGVRLWDTAFVIAEQKNVELLYILLSSIFEKSEWFSVKRKINEEALSGLQKAKGMRANLEFILPLVEVGALEELIKLIANNFHMISHFITEFFDKIPFSEIKEVLMKVSTSIGAITRFSRIANFLKNWRNERKREEKEKIVYVFLVPIDRLFPDSAAKRYLEIMGYFDFDFVLNVCVHHLDENFSKTQIWAEIKIVPHEYEEKKK